MTDFIMEAMGPFEIKKVSPEEAIEKIVKTRFREAYNIAALGPCCKESGFERLDIESNKAKILLKKMSPEKKEFYSVMIAEKYYEYVKKISEITYVERGPPKENEPLDIIEHSINFGFPRSLRTAGFSYPRGLREFNRYAERAYDMLRRLNPDERREVEKTLNEKYDKNLREMHSLKPDSN